MRAWRGYLRGGRRERELRLAPPPRRAEVRNSQSWVSRRVGGARGSRPSIVDQKRRRVPSVARHRRVALRKFKNRMGGKAARHLSFYQLKVLNWRLHPRRGRDGRDSFCLFSASCGGAAGRVALPPPPPKYLNLIGAPPSHPTSPPPCSSKNS